MADVTGLEPVRRHESCLIDSCDPVHPARRFLIRTRLYAAAARSKHWLIFSRPMCLALLIPAVDFDRSGSLNVNDFVAFLNAWAANQ